MWQKINQKSKEDNDQWDNRYGLAVKRTLIMADTKSAAKAP